MYYIYMTYHPNDKDELAKGRIWYYNEPTEQQSVKLESCHTQEQLCKVHKHNMVKW